MSRPGRRRLVLVVATMLMVAAVVGGVVRLVGSGDDPPPGATQAAAMLAAKKAAIQFFTLDPDDVAAQVDEMLEVATGKFLREYKAQRSAVIANVQSKKRQVSAEVPKDGVAIATYSTSEAVVLVATDVTSRESTAAATSHQYRMRLTMVRTGTVWKASTLDQLAGVAGPGSYRPGKLAGGNTAVLAAASTAVTKALAYDYRDLDKSLTDTLGVLTPRFGTQFAGTFTSTVRPLALQKKATTAAYVRAVGLVLRDGDTARCLVFADQVLNPAATATVSEARVYVDLKRISGRWLVDNLSRA